MRTNRICCLIHIPQRVLMPSEIIKANHKAYTAQKHCVKEEMNTVTIQK